MSKTDKQSKQAMWARRRADGRPLKGQKRRDARRAAGKDGYRGGKNA